MTDDGGLRLEEISFSYGDEPVLARLSLHVRSSSLFALLGPSGSGKSTLLGIVAGLLRPDQGRILLDGRDVTHEPPERRGIGVVFQSYALFPHLSALDNIAFGPRQQGVPADERRARAEELGERLGLGGALHRRPDELSGGQQQRVALARALALRPRMLLLDEPLSNIDPALRTAVRAELRAWLQRWSITTVLVTHDREDAFWLADELGLLRNGRLIQQGTPAEIYRRPVDAEAARLLGPVNVLPEPRGEDRRVLVRPEELRFVAVPAEAPDRSLPARLETVVDLGPERRGLCRLPDGATVWVGRIESSFETGHDGHVLLPSHPWTVESDGREPVP